jgi:hypothetical protein
MTTRLEFISAYDGESDYQPYRRGEAEPLPRLRVRFNACRVPVLTMSGRPAPRDVVDAYNRMTAANYVEAVARCGAFALPYAPSYAQAEG